MNKFLKDYGFLFTLVLLALFSGGLSYTITTFAEENIITEEYLQKTWNDNNLEVEITGLTEAVSGTLKIPAVLTKSDSSDAEYTYKVVSISKSAGNYTNITRLDLENADNLASIKRATFQNCTSLTEKVVFPKNLTSIGSNAFSGTNLTQMEFLGELTDGINFTGNIPSSVSKILVSKTSYNALTAESSLLQNVADASIINYYYYVNVNGTQTDLRKELNSNFTSADYVTLSEGIENCIGFKVEGDETLYNSLNFTTLKANDKTLTPVIEEEKQTFNVIYSSGNGYAVSGETTVEEGQNLEFLVTLNEYYNESDWQLKIYDENQNELSYSNSNTGDVYTVTVENVTSNLDVKITNVVPNDFEINLSTSNTSDLTVLSEMDFNMEVLGNVNVNNLSYSWTSEQISISNNTSQIKLSNLSVGDYVVTAVVTYTIDGNEITKTKSFSFKVSDITFSVNYPEQQIGYTLTGVSSVNYGESLTFNFALKPAYTESEFVIYVFDDNDNLVYSTDYADKNFFIENITCNLSFVVNRVKLNSFEVTLDVKEESGESTDLAGIGSNLTVNTVFSGNIPYSDATYRYFLNDVELTENTSSFNLYNMKKGGYTVKVEVYVPAANKTYEVSNYFYIYPRYATVNLNLSDFVFNNTNFLPEYEVEYLNICSPYDFGEVFEKFNGETWEEVTEVKNVGVYRLALTYDEEEIELSDGSVVTCEFEITPKEITVYYNKADYMYEFNNTRQYPQVHYESNNESVSEYWASLGLSASDVKERLYVKNGELKTLVYELPVLSSSEAYDEYSGYLVNAGEYTLELYCVNPNFTFKTTSSRVTSVDYVITQKHITVSMFGSGIYGYSQTHPTNSFSYVINNQTQEEISYTVAFSREAGDNVGEYAITGIASVSLETPNININNFVFELSEKSDNKYVIREKLIYINWDEQTEFAFDGEYHAPTCWVSDDHNGEVVLTVNGKQMLPNEKLESYTATATCTSKNFQLINDTIEFKIKPTTLVGENSGMSVSINSTNGFNPNSSLVFENASVSNTLTTSILSSYEEDYKVNGSYTIKVVDEESNEVGVTGGVSLNLEKPEYYKDGMKILQVLNGGLTKEVSYTVSGNYLVVENVKVGSSFIFISPEREVNITLMLALLVSVVTSIFIPLWIYYKKRKKKMVK